jgi:hypothetical protein
MAIGSSTSVFFDQTLFDVSQQLFERGPLHRRARQATIIIRSLAQSPAFSLLTPDVGFTRLALGVQRIEVLLEPFFEGLADVDRVTQCLLLTRLHSSAPSSVTSSRRTADPTSGCR